MQQRCPAHLRFASKAVIVRPMSDFVRVFTIGGKTGAMMTITGIMITKRVPADRRVSG
jgi:hypothetical protein